MWFLLYSIPAHCQPQSSWSNYSPNNSVFFSSSSEMPPHVEKIWVFMRLIVSCQRSPQSPSCISQHQLTRTAWTAPRPAVSWSQRARRDWGGGGATSREQPPWTINLTECKHSPKVIFKNTDHCLRCRPKPWKPEELMIYMSAPRSPSPSAISSGPVAPQEESMRHLCLLTEEKLPSGDSATPTPDH